MACHWKPIWPPRKMSKVVPVVRSEPRKPPMPRPPPSENFTVSPSGMSYTRLIMSDDDLVAASGEERAGAVQMGAVRGEGEFVLQTQAIAPGITDRGGADGVVLELDLEFAGTGGRGRDVVADLIVPAAAKTQIPAIPASAGVLRAAAATVAMASKRSFIFLTLAQNTDGQVPPANFVRNQFSVYNGDHDEMSPWPMLLCGNKLPQFKGFTGRL